MNKALRTVAVFILLLVLLSLYGYAIKYVVRGGEKLGFLTTPIVHFINFPHTAYNALTSNEIRGLPPTFAPEDASFSSINRLDTDLYAMNSFYEPVEKLWEIKLFNLRNDSVARIWKLSEEDFEPTVGRLFMNSRPSGGLLLPDGSIVAYLGHTNNLYRLDKDSRIIWHNTEKMYHHSMELDDDGNIWVCTYSDRQFQLGPEKRTGYFRDDCITKVSSASGEILFDKSLSEILIENGYKNFVYGFSNTINPEGMTDPLHLNDIEPVLEDGPYWNKGDLFLSLRHMSLVIHYRPETNSIERLLFGPFLFQHDVDLISETEIAIFNNNTTNIGVFGDHEDHLMINEVPDELLYSEVLIYNYSDSTYRSYFEDHFADEEIYTRTEGSYSILSSGQIYVESQNDNKIYILDEGEVILQKQLKTNRDGYVHMLNAMRIFEDKI